MQQGELITVNITPSGTVSIDASGFRGTSCEEATASLEIVLGGGIAKKKHKPERSMPASSVGQKVNQQTF